MPGGMEGGVCIPGCIWAGVCISGNGEKEYAYLAPQVCIPRGIGAGECIPGGMGARVCISGGMEAAVCIPGWRQEYAYLRGRSMHT